MQFTDEEVETLKTILSDHGSDCPRADYAKVQALGVKLGVWEEEKPPTEEELKRREEFRNSFHGMQIANRLKQSNEYLEKLNKEYKSDLDFMDEFWGTVKINPGMVSKLIK